jgi:large subunit ribosomal protein L14e
MFEPGRLCVKIAGRDAGKTCVIVKRVDDLIVLIDGETRRRKCNIRHLEPLEKTVNLNEDASHDEVKAVFEKLGLVARDTKPKKVTERAKKQHKKKVKPVKTSKVEKKKAVKKVAAKKTEAPVVEKAPKIEEKVEAKTSSDAAAAYVKDEAKK